MTDKIKNESAVKAYWKNVSCELVKFEENRKRDEEKSADDELKREATFARNEFVSLFGEETISKVLTLDSLF